MFRVLKSRDHINSRTLLTDPEIQTSYICLGRRVYRVKYSTESRLWCRVSAWAVPLANADKRLSQLRHRLKYVLTFLLTHSPY